MKSNTLIWAVCLALFLVAGIGANPSFADTTTTASSVACPVFLSNVQFGASDRFSGGAVTSLQNFLVTQGYFNSSALGSGHFGPQTLAAVIRFQVEHGVPGTGLVGPMTRAAIARLNCSPAQPPVSTSPSLYFLSPTSGVAGNTLSITGFGLTGDNTVLFDGLVAARNVPITSTIAVACTTDPSCRGGIRQTLTFSVPTSLSPNCPTGSMCPMFVRLLTPGNYSVTIMNSNGTSNALSFTVTGGGATQPVSINGLDAPATLALGTTGTWTVRVVSGTGTGTLHYSVIWGDEVAGTASFMQPTSTSVTTSATFTHAYQHSGTFTPLFTVTDDAGHTATVSNSITVTPLF